MSRPTRDCLDCKRVAGLEKDVYGLAELEHARHVVMFVVQDTDMIDYERLSPIFNGDWLSAEESRIFATNRLTRSKG